MTKKRIQIIALLSSLSAWGCGPASEPTPDRSSGQSSDQNSAQLSRTRPAEPKNAEPAMTPKALIIAWIGPSDRPTPPTVLWSDKASRDSAAAWLAKQGMAPVGVTDVETNPEALKCAGDAAGQSKGTRLLLEITTWDGAKASSPVRLDSDASKAFLATATSCVGPTSPAAGYLKSLLTIVGNASK